MTVAPGTCINLYSAGPLGNAVWGTSNVTLTAVAGSGSPTGYATEVAATSNGSITLQNYDGSNTDFPSTRYTFSVWLKQQTLTSNNSNIYLWLTTYNGNGAGAVNGVVLQVPLSNPGGAIAQLVTNDTTSQPWSSPQFSVLALPNGWYEVSVSGISGSDLTNADLSASINTLNLSSQWQSVGTGESFLLGGACVYYDFGPTPPPPFVLTTDVPASVYTYPNFDFPFTSMSESYPANSRGLNLGSSYVLMTAPIAPPQRKFTLDFEGFGWDIDSTGTVSLTTGVQSLVAFYKAVQLYGAFTFQHPIDGQLLVRFARPLDIPAVMKGAPFNTVHSFQVELVEVITSQPPAVPATPLNLSIPNGNAPYWEPWSGSWNTGQITTAVPPPVPGALVYSSTRIADKYSTYDSNLGVVEFNGVVGATYAFSVWVWVPSSQSSAIISVQFRSDDWNNFVTTQADMTLTDQWQLITGAGIWAGTSTPDWITVAGGSEATPNGTYLYLSAPMVNTGDIPQPFVGGTYPLFDFPYATFAEKFPSNGLSVQAPNGYQFSTPPQGPPIRVFTLSFEGMGWLINPATGEYDSTYNPHWNIAALRAFYQQVQLYGIFYYPHPVDGLITVRFARPLDIPAVRKGAPFNTVKTFQVELVEVF